MGNCLVLQENVIKVMKTDGKVLEYRAPMKAEQVLSEFSSHALSETVPVLQHLQPDTRLSGGRLYYLVPLALQQADVTKKTKKKIKKVRFANQDVDQEDVTEAGVMRVKLVIRKSELHEMLQKGGVSLEDIVSQSHERGNGNTGDTFVTDNYSKCKTVLESIPEVD